MVGARPEDRPARPRAQRDPTMATRSYFVPGISCGHCKAAIESELSDVQGVVSASVDIEARTVAVTGDATDEAVRAAIDEAGYEVAGLA